MLTENKVTYLNTLHPEEGHTALAHGKEEYAGKWDAVWAEAVPVEDSSEATSQDNDPERVVEADTTVKEDHSCHRFNFLVLLVGWSLLVAAASAAIMMEFASAILYIVASGFHWVAEKFHDLGIVGVVFYFLFSAITSILLFMDALVLVLATFVTELLAGIAFGLCFLFGGFSAASDWHQSIRRTCHLGRWAFRGFHEDWPCKRVLSPASAFGKEETAENTQVDSVPEKVPETKADPEDGTIVLGMEEVVVEEEGLPPKDTITKESSLQ